MGMGFLSKVMKMFWNSTVVMIAQLSEYTRNHSIVCFTRVCELYLNKVFFFFLSACELSGEKGLELKARIRDLGLLNLGVRDLWGSRKGPQGTPA